MAYHLFTLAVASSSVLNSEVSWLSSAFIFWTALKYESGYKNTQIFIHLIKKNILTITNLQIVITIIDFLY